jgi:hypothetical protein
MRLWPPAAQQDVRFRVDFSQFLLTLGVASPVPVGILCVAYFVVQVNRMGVGSRHTTGRFLGWIFVWAVIGIALAFLVVTALTAFYDSLPGALVFLFFAPMALSCGLVIGTAVWRKREAKPNPSLQSGPPASGRPLS